MTQPTLIQRSSPNVGGSFTPLGICNHVTAGPGGPAVDWLCNPASEVSAHFVVMEDGQIYQLVALDQRAWGEGITSAGSQWTPIVPAGANPNQYLISIEHAGTPFDPSFMNEAQYQASLALQRWLVETYQIPIDRDHLVGHYLFDHINRANCPGPNYPWVRLLADLQGEQPVLRETPADWPWETWKDAAINYRGIADALGSQGAAKDVAMAKLVAAGNDAAAFASADHAAMQQRIDALVGERDKALARAQALDAQVNQLQAQPSIASLVARVQKMHSLALQLAAV